MLLTRFIATLFVLLWVALPAHALNEEDLLPPEQAFQTDVSIDADNRIEVRVNIVDGYYLYRDKFTFTTEPDNIVLSDWSMPAGKVKHDEFFGEVETYRGDIVLTAQVSDTASASDFTLNVRSQGCADLGICYPPMTLPFTLAMATPPEQDARASAPANPLMDISQALNGDFGGEEEFLDPDVAFVPTVSKGADGQVQVDWAIADGYYLYRDKFGFEVPASTGVTIDAVQLSDGEIKDDPFFGKIEVYHHAVQAQLAVTGAASTDTDLQLTYQGCAEAGICYPPIKKTLSIAAGLIGAANAAPAATAPAAADQASAPLSEQDRIAESMSSGSLLGIVATFFGLGLLLAFTPCVFPMIPILSSIIVGQGEDITTRKALTLSLVYVLAMALTYTIVGVIVGLSGENVQAVFQNPWVLSAFAALFVVLSLSMFGFYELQMPASIQSRLTALSNRQEGGTLAGVAIMGFLSALIVGPCVTAPLVGALIYIAQTGDAVIGGVALFSLSIGMGVPLIIIGVSAGRYLPRAGAWMDVTKSIFGVLLLGLAIWMLERFLPLWATMYLAAALLIVSGIYLGALESIPADKSSWSKLWKGLGILLFIYGVLLFIGASFGGTSFFKPLQGVASTSTQSHDGSSPNAGHLQFQTVKGVDGLQTALNTATANGQAVMLDFYADWCISCKEMEAYTFTDAGVQSALNNVLLLQTDVTDNDDKDKALLKHFGLFGPPAIIFYNSDGIEQRHARVVGYMNAETFTQQIVQAIH